MKKGNDYIGVGVGALIVEGDNILLLQRNKEPEIGGWAIPGGAVEMFETVEGALLREIDEELGVEIRIIKLLGVTNHILNDTVHWVSPCYLTQIVNGKPYNKEPHKHVDMRWFNLYALPQNITMTTKNAVKEYLKYLEEK